MPTNFLFHNWDMTGIQENQWPTTTEEAKLIQQQLRDQVIRVNDLGKVHHVAGVDAGFEDNGKTTRAAVAVLSFPELELVEKTVVRQTTCFPYIPGYLSFRELPAVLVLFQCDIAGFSWSVSVHGKARLVADGHILCKRRNAAMDADRPTLRTLLWCPAAALRAMDRMSKCRECMDAQEQP